MIAAVVAYLRAYAADLPMVERFPGGERASGVLLAADLIERKFGGQR
jgi:hypothetical protein